MIFSIQWRIVNADGTLLTQDILASILIYLLGLCPLLEGNATPDYNGVPNSDK